MSTKTAKNKKPQILPTKQGQEAMAKIMASLQKVDTDTPDAKLNEFSMDDNNGGRIIFFIVDGNKYIFTGNRKKTLELLQLLEGSLKLVSWGEKAVTNKPQSGLKTKPAKTR